MIHFDDYHFKKRLNIIDEHLKSGKVEIDKDLLESYANKTKEIRDEIENFPYKIYDEYLDTSVIMDNLKNNYQENEFMPGSMDLYTIFV